MESLLYSYIKQKKGSAFVRLRINDDVTTITLQQRELVVSDLRSCTGSSKTLYRIDKKLTSKLNIGKSVLKAQ